MYFLAYSASRVCRPRDEAVRIGVGTPVAHILAILNVKLPVRYSEGTFY